MIDSKTIFINAFTNKYGDEVLNAINRLIAEASDGKVFGLKVEDAFIYKYSRPFDKDSYKARLIHYYKLAGFDVSEGVNDFIIYWDVPQ